VTPAIVRDERIRRCPNLRLGAVEERGDDEESDELKAARAPLALPEGAGSHTDCWRRSRLLSMRSSLSAPIEEVATAISHGCAPRPIERWYR
jgi:hypothetical protein